MAAPAFADGSATDNLAELQMKGDYYQTPSSNVQGGAGYSLDTTLYTPVIDTNWRLFAGQLYAHENEPFSEGNISLWSSIAGVEYHNDLLTVSLAPTFNYYNENDRIGANGSATWIVNDQWTVGAGSQIFSVDTSLRALNEDITSNFYNTNILWHQGDVRSFRLDANVLTFSDENVRGEVSGLYTEQFYTDSKFTLAGIGSLTESQDSQDEQAYYFNPKMDLLGSAGLKATQILYKDGDTQYLHSLQILPGEYWQENYGNSFAFDARYELRAHLSDKFDVGLGGDFNHQAADGVEENSVTVLFDLTSRL